MAEPRALLAAARPLVVTAVVAIAATFPAGAGAVAPRASFTDVEDEVICVVCGVPLNIAEAPQADRERAYIRRLIAEGKTKAQIKRALVRQFGPEVLPAERGLSLSGYLLPIIAAALGVAALAAAGRRWRRAGQDAVA